MGPQSGVGGGNLLQLVQAVPFLWRVAAGLSAVHFAPGAVVAQLGVPPHPHALRASADVGILPRRSSVHGFHGKKAASRPLPLASASGVVLGVAS